MRASRMPLPAGRDDKGKPGESRRRKAPRLPHAFQRATPVEPPNLTLLAPEGFMRLPTIWYRAALLGVALFAACEQLPNALDPDFGVLTIALAPHIDTVLVGDSIRLTATVVMNNNQAPRALNWTSAMSALASVSQTGMVRGLHAGSGFIVASSGNKKDSAAVTVLSQTPPPPVPVAMVAVSPASETVRLGATAQLTATPKDGSGNPLTGRTITWASNNAGVATVNGSGFVTTVAVGAATITISPATVSLLVGVTAQLSATTKDSAGNVLTGRTVTWASSNTAVATVSGAGLVTGKAAGSATITATSEGKSGTASATVANVPVASVTVSPATASLQVGGTLQLAATTKDAAGNVLTGRSIAWSSSSTALATVSASGLVTAVATGPVTVTAASEGKNGSASVSVTAAGGSCTPTYGSFGVGTWPAACYQVYDANAWINRPLSAGLQVDPSSAA